LSDARAGDVAKVQRVSDRSPEILQYAARLGIVLGARVRVQERVDFDGSLRVEVGGREVMVSDKLADSVHVDIAPAKRRSL
jgi:DtxR family Mn-dependent transcriptional regulator